MLLETGCHQFLSYVGGRIKERLRRIAIGDRVRPAYAGARERKLVRGVVGLTVNEVSLPSGSYFMTPYHVQAVA